MNVYSTAGRNRTTIQGVSSNWNKYNNNNIYNDSMITIR